MNSMPGGMNSMPGGAQRNTDPNAPQSIESDDLRFFDVSCYFFGLTPAAAYPYIGGYAVKTDFGALAGVQYLNADAAPYTEPVTSFAPVSGKILGVLHEIAKNGDFVQNNGNSFHIGGLPPMFGGHVNLGYESGEYIRKDNNQSMVISPDAGAMIVDAIRRALAEDRVEVARGEDIVRVTYYEERENDAFTRISLEGNRLSSEYRFGPEERLHFVKECEVPEGALDKIREMAAKNGLFALDGAPENPDGFFFNKIERVTFTMRDGSEHVLHNRMRLPGPLSSSLFSISQLLQHAAE